jgi:hypothetical protein
MIKLLGKTNIQGKTIFDTGYSVSDANAAAYISAVEAADGATLEDPVKIAIENFIVGCKSDGIWNSLKASCILAGARTLNGALVPLVGTAPTNFNFVSADYNRETGLKGNGSTKYLNSNRANNADPQDNFHMAVNKHSTSIVGTDGYLFGASVASGGSTSHIIANTGFIVRAASWQAVNVGNYPVGFIGASRSGPTTTQMRYLKSTGTSAAASSAPSSTNLFVFARSYNGALNGPTNSRLNFYSIGESLNLALLDTRVSDLMTALAAAI